MQEFITNISNGVRVTDVLDILIVTFIIYKIINFIQETRAQQLVKGLLILLFIYLMSDLLKLYTLNWILKGTLTMGILAIVIVFQPELRRGLERVGRSKLVKSAISQSDIVTAETIISEIIKAVSFFSESRTGALIVVEQQVSLNDIAETGTILDSLISAPILENIFYEGSPLHDGAAVIRSGRIYAAGCVLPLTKDPELSPDLGTRHRAGIGITETSDAVTFIVSEESGIISIAASGKIDRFIDIKTVEETLKGLLMPEEGTGKKLKEKIKRMGRG